MDFDTSPEKIGPGAWNTMHNTAAGADEMDSSQGIKYFCDFIWNMLNRFPCNKCRNHALQFVSMKDPAEFAKHNPAHSYPLSRWTFDFHNFVNTRLKKPTWTWETYKTIYIDRVKPADMTICQSGCDD